MWKDEFKINGGGEKKYRAVRIPPSNIFNHIL
jgi:hypothetical protein